VPGPRYYAPENSKSGLEEAVGALLGGFETANNYRRQRKQEAQSDEDRQREIDREARGDAIGDYEKGVTTQPQPTGTVPGPTSVSRPVYNEQPAASTPAPDGGESLEQAVGRTLGTPDGSLPQSVFDRGAGGALPQSVVPTVQRPGAGALSGTAQAGVPSTNPQEQSGGFLSRVGSMLGRMKDNATTGGYHPRPTPTYTVSRTGPSARERELGVGQAGETQREGMREKSAADIAAGNNRTSVRVAEIAADSRENSANLRYSGMNDPRLKVSMQAMNNQIQAYDRAITDVDKLIKGTEPSLVDGAKEKASKEADKAKYMRQRESLEAQQRELRDRYLNMTMAAANNVADFSGFIPQPDQYQKPDPNGVTPSGGSSQPDYLGSRYSGQSPFQGAPPAGAAPAGAAPPAQSLTRAQIEQAYQAALARGVDPQAAAQRRDALLKNAAP
jgi:hypothetical protein